MEEIRKAARIISERKDVLEHVIWAEIVLQPRMQQRTVVDMLVPQFVKKQRGGRPVGFAETCLGADRGADFECVDASSPSVAGCDEHTFF